MIRKLLTSLLLLIITIYSISNSTPSSGHEVAHGNPDAFNFNILSEEGIGNDILGYAIEGYSELLEKNLLGKDSLLTIIDFSKICNANRFFVINLNSGEILYKSMVAHGMNSGGYYATDFSNKSCSRKSSLGFYITQNTYYGKHGYSLRIKGLEENYNSNALQRGVVIHGAHYVSEDYMKKNGRIGRSFGCPALPEDINAEVIDCIKEGSCVFIYYPDTTYLKSSLLLN